MAAPGVDYVGVLSSCSRLIRTMQRPALAELARKEAGIALERPAIQILGVLKKSEHALSVKEVAEALQVEGPHVTRHLQKLAQRGLVEKTVDPHDRRVARLELTAEGTDLIDRYHEVLRRWVREAMSDWPEAERKRLCQLLDQLVTDVTTYADQLIADDTP